MFTWTKCSNLIYNIFPSGLVQRSTTNYPEWILPDFFVDGKALAWDGSWQKLTGTFEKAINFGETSHLCGSVRVGDMDFSRGGWVEKVLGITFLGNKKNGKREGKGFSQIEYRYLNTVSNSPVSCNLSIWRVNTWEKNGQGYSPTIDILVSRFGTRDDFVQKSPNELGDDMILPF